MPSPQKRLGVSDLNNPRSRGPFRTVKQRAFSMNVQEYLLHKVVRFDSVSENPFAYISDKVL